MNDPNVGERVHTWGCFRQYSMRGVRWYRWYVKRRTDFTWVYGSSPFVGKSTELIRKELADMFARKYPKALRAIELRSDLPPGFDMGCSLVCLNETRC